MKVVMVEPGQYARIEEMNTGLESLQKAVGGLIDCAYPWQEKVCIVCNDEGLLNGMPLNRNVEDYQPIAGPFFVCGIEGDDFCSLTDEQAERYKAMFLQPELFIPYKNGLMQLKYDNPDLPGAPEKLKQEYESRNNLPMYSFCCATGVDMVMMVVPFPVSWTVKMKKKQKETQDILSYHTQAAGCSDKARAKASGGRQPIEECGRTGL